MDIKHNINYFKRKDSIKTVAIILLIIGGILLLVGWGFISYILTMLFLPGGVALFIISSIITSSESDIDTALKRSLEGVEKELAEDKRYSKRLLKNIPSKIAEGYNYEAGLMLRKNKDSSLRSSSYTKAVLYPLTDALIISSRTVSLTSIEVKNEFLEIPYIEIEDIETVTEEKELTFEKNTYKVKSVRIIIKHSDGLVFSAPFNDTISSEEFIKKLQKLISDAKAVS